MKSKWKYLHIANIPSASLSGRLFWDISMVNPFFMAFGGDVDMIFVYNLFVLLFN